MEEKDGGMDMGGQLAARAQQARSSYRFADTVTPVLPQHPSVFTQALPV